MKIFCPVCDTSIEVSKILVGQKGRCPRCSSKFIIPETPGDETEILERGEIPKDEPAPVPPPPAKEPEPKSEPRSEKKASKPKKASSAARTGERRVVPATGAPARSTARPVVVKQSSGVFGFLFAIVLAALVGVVVYVMMDQRREGGASADKPAAEPPAIETPEPKAANPVAAPVVPVEKLATEGLVVYSKVLQPLFEAKCNGCHGEEKRKGRLAMHTYEKLMAGSGNGSIVAADADDQTRIEIIFRAELPEADEEHMPPQGEPQLTPDELAILKWWIKAGAHEDIDSNEAPEDIRKKVQNLARL